MKILVVSTSPWKNENSIGNTFSNWFEDQSDMEFSNIFFRSGMPNNTVCKDYFRITTVSNIKHCLSKEKIGTHFTCNGETQKSATSDELQAEQKERRFIDFLHRHNLQFVHGLEDTVWKMGRWKNSKLLNYVKEYDPDIIFSFALGSNPDALMLQYLKEHSRAKLVLYVADDVHAHYSIKRNAISKRRKKNLSNIINTADLLYTASQEMAEKYARLYGRTFYPLYKGCDLQQPPKATVNQPIKLVYAGNIQLGRDEILANLAASIQRLNADQPKAMLEIYSNNTVTEDMQSRLNIPGCSALCKPLPYEQIKKKLSEADIVLHVESFAEEHTQYTRFSFSTKIIDCLQSGSVLLVIGPAGLSSVEYPRKIPGAIVVDNLELLDSVLNGIVSAPEKLPVQAASIRKFAEEHHQINQVRTRLYQDFSSLL